ncbi:methyltransferase [Streptomyces coeruleoprunus]|uniref:Methyltransferase n=1 Tax=Streptomyces coeruleoprunus TaxID=285563 RepID=A0ABV9XFN5_9ACTN
MEKLSMILFGHAAFQYLNAACELGLFELLAEKGPLTAEEVRSGLGLEERAGDILLLGCAALGLIHREDGSVRLSDLIAGLMEQGTWEHLANTVAFEQHIVYEGQADFTESLRRNTNVGLRRIPGDDRDLYRRLAATPALEEVFYRYMRSWSLLANEHLVASLDLSGARTLLDCGGGDAVNAIALARANPHLRVTVLEIPASVRVAEESVRRAGLADRITVRALDILHEPFPTGYDCVLFAHQLVIWTPEENTELLRKAHDALVPGGRVAVFNSMSDDTGDGPLIAALDSVYFAALPAEGGMIYPWSRHEASLAAAGFTEPVRIPLPTWTPHGILIATRPR